MESAYPIGHTFHGVTTDDPIDGPSYIAIAFQALINSPYWRDARQTFAGFLLRGFTIDSARLETIRAHGI